MPWTERELTDAITSVRLSGYDADGHRHETHTRNLADAVDWAGQYREVIVWAYGLTWPRAISRIRPLAERNRVAIRFSAALKAHLHAAIAATQDRSTDTSVAA